MTSPTDDGPAPSTAEEPAPSLAEVTAAIEAMHPVEWAQPWDAVGLVCGDPDAPVRRVLFAVDPVEAVVDEALALGVDLLVTHHPLLLKPVNSVAATSFKGRLVHRLIEAGCGLLVAHTNADAGAPGVSDALARVLDLDDLVPLEPLTGFGREDLGIGRVGNLSAPERLGDFADRVAEALPETEHGVRIAGDLDALVQRVAVCGGSGDSLFDAVRASGADVFVTADLRHHPASEARERAVFEGSRPGGAPTPHLVDVSHWASEWPWLAGCADRLVAAMSASGRTVVATVSTTRTDPWTLRVPSRGE